MAAARVRSGDTVQKGRVHVGTSGWTYDEWTGPFYPPDVKGADRLTYYAHRFDTVEVNATFYRLPFRNMIRGWNDRLPTDFHTVLKGPRTVTHMKKLADCGDQVARFFDRVGELRTLRAILWQLPPSLHKDLDRLAAFLDELPEDVRHAVEFRHPSWWDDDAAALLTAYGAAFVAVSHPRLPEDVIVTSDFLYLRFHGKGKRLYDYHYSAQELAGWVGRVARLLGECDTYAFFNNDIACRAPGDARRFREMLERAAR
jgi:uncharacterized protein YecE (DUF72 family)